MTRAAKYHDKHDRQACDAAGAERCPPRVSFKRERERERERESRGGMYVARQIPTRDTTSILFCALRVLGCGRILSK